LSTAEDLLAIAIALITAHRGFAGRIDDGGPVFLGNPFAIDVFYTDAVTANLAGIDSPTCTGTAVLEQLLGFFA